MPETRDAGEEAARLDALRQYCVLDTPREERFDRITRLAARLCQTPVAAISLIDADRQWFKSRFGLGVDQSAREHAFCRHTILAQGPLIVPDAAADPRFAANPYVVGEPGFRFYAGVALRVESGHALGTLCILDYVPRQFSAADVRALVDLARSVVAELELDRAVRRLQAELLERDRVEAALRASQRRLEDFLSTASDLFWETDEQLRFTGCGGATTLLGESVNSLIGSTFWERLDRLEVDPVQLARLRDDIAARLPFRGVEFRRTGSGGRHVWLDASGIPVFDPQGGFCGYRGTTRNITRRKWEETRIRRMAEEDPLTGLANRRLFQARLEQTTRAAAIGESVSALLLLDLDRFKQVNDGLGHAAGDALLCEVGRRVAHCLRETDLIARIGGDEFGVVLDGIGGREEAELAAARIAEALREPMLVGGQVVSPQASIGIAILPDDATCPAEAHKRADEALYRAKTARQDRPAGATAIGPEGDGLGCLAFVLGPFASWGEPAAAHALDDGARGHSRPAAGSAPDSAAPAARELSPDLTIRMSSSSVVSDVGVSRTISPAWRKLMRSQTAKI